MLFLLELVVLFLLELVSCLSAFSLTGVKHGVGTVRMGQRGGHGQKVCGMTEVFSGASCLIFQNRSIQFIEK